MAPCSSGFKSLSNQVIKERSHLAPRIVVPSTNMETFYFCNLPNLKLSISCLVTNTQENQNIKLQSRILCFSRKLTSNLVEIKVKKSYNFPMIANRAIVQFQLIKTHPKSHDIHANHQGCYYGCNQRG